MVQEEVQNVEFPAPARIRAARDLRMLTQSETVARMHQPVTTAALSQIESGKVTPSTRTLTDLAGALDVPAGFFSNGWTESGTDVSDQVIYFRDLAATPSKQRRRAAALALILNDLILALETRVRLPRVSVPSYPVAPGANREEIEDIAQALRGEWNLGDEPIPHVVREIERHGVPVARLSLGSRAVDAFSVRFKRRPIIFLTDDKSNYVRSRFDAAHELAHIVMHEHADANDRTIEGQAHDMAASLLLPAAVARNILPREMDPRAWRQLAELKREWGMSMAALLYRARDLSVLPPDSYRNAMKYMSFRGWRAVEPGDRQMGRPEPSELFEKVLRQIKSDYNESPTDIARSARLPIVDALELVTASMDRRPVINF